MTRRLTKINFTERASIIHNNKYKYLNVIYKNNSTKVSITCDIHGDFLQTPANHLNGQGCPKCKLINIFKNTKWNNDKFYKLIKNLPANNYLYDNININSREDSIIYTCKKHGSFKTIVRFLTEGGECPECRKARGDSYLRLNTHDFINRARNVHGDFYNYDKSIYVSFNKPIKIICPIHGEFEQLVSNHLSGKGCSKCGRINKNNSNKFTEKELINKFKFIWGNTFKYPTFIYNNRNQKLDIKCTKCGTIFKQAIRDHLRKRNGCPVCQEYKGWSRSQWIKFCINKNTIPMVYIIRFFDDNEDFIKIGITSNNTVVHRCSHIPYSYEIIKEIKGSPDFIWDKEKELHIKYKDYKYMPIKDFGGKYECFNKYILDFI